MENTMTSMVKVFENKEFGAVRVMEQNGEPWFVGKEVAEILGYSNASKAVSVHVDKEDKQFMMIDIADSQFGNLPRGKTKTAVINESGLYSLILSSKLPTAKEFKRWVTSEILPTIRKTGGYINNARQLVSTYFANTTPEQQTALELTFENLRIAQEQLRIAKPKADYFDKLVDAGANLGIRQFAKELKVSERKLVKFMLDNHYLYRSKKGKLLPYAEYTGTLFEVKEFVAENGYTNVKTLFTPAGRDCFLKLGIVDKLKEAC